MRRPLALLLPLLILGLPPQTLARTAVPNRAVVVSNGVQVTASVAQRTYPHITVMTGLGQQVFPPLVQAPEPPGPPIEACLAARPTALRPGQTLHWEQDAVLRGAHLMVHLGL